MAYIFTHATVLDGTADMEPRPNATVVVNDEGRTDRRDEIGRAHV